MNWHCCFYRLRREDGVLITGAGPQIPAPSLKDSKRPKTNVILSSQVEVWDQTWSQLGNVVSYLGQEQFTHSEAEASGEPPLPVKEVMLGKVTGKSSRGTGTGPQAGQWTMGMGVPQYRCREISQSFSLSLVTSPPTLFLRALWVRARNASGRFIPVNWEGKERDRVPPLVRMSCHPDATTLDCHFLCGLCRATLWLSVAFVGTFLLTVLKLIFYDSGE